MELAAPGVNIYSTAAGNRYHALSGTSQAAACVSGAAALYLQSLDFDLNRDATIDSQDTRLMLQLTTEDLGPRGPDDIFGFGLVNVLETSFEPVTNLTITRLYSGYPRADEIGEVELTDAPHCLTLINDRTMLAIVDVYEGTTHRDDLSQIVSFPQWALKAAFCGLMPATPAIPCAFPSMEAGALPSNCMSSVRRSSVLICAIDRSATGKFRKNSQNTRCPQALISLLYAAALSSR